MTQIVPASKSTSPEVLITIGIDVSKDHLDAARYPSGETIRVTNTPKGHTTLLRWLVKGPQAVRVVFEATGPYHKVLEQRLNADGLPVVKVNPRQARRFADATGSLAKTDRADALMLARFGALLEPVIRPARSEMQNQLAELVAARRSLMRDRTATLNRLQILTISLLKRHARHRLRQLETQVASLDTAIAAIIEADSALSRKRNILLSIPGLGVVTVQALLADMPELGTMDEGQAAALAGLAPITRQSGQWQGKSVIGGGRSALRKALYMPALVDTRFNPDFKRFYDRLVAQGKPPKLAITAVMRKLVILANVLLRDDRIWTLKTT